MTILNSLRDVSHSFYKNNSTKHIILMCIYYLQSRF